MLNLSPKQKEAFNNSNARLNFLIGSVRSGKTFASLLRWLKYIQEAPEGNFVMIGKSATTIKRNLVDEICNLISVDARYYSGKNELVIWNKKIYLVGGSDERSEQRIRGASFAGAYVDECSLIPASLFKMLLSRLSIPNAKCFITTNTDSPFHWLKIEYLDRADELDLKTFEFTLEDNPSLTQTFKDNLRQEYQGLWYKRYIEGKWCLAEGTVYDFFDEKIHVIDFPPAASRYYVCGIDYGTTNACAFLLIGYDPNNFPNIWIEDEYYYDSRKEFRQKTDSEYAEDLKKFLGYRNVKAIYIDPSAASFKAELIKQGVQNIQDANNDVLDGIRFTAKLMANGTLKICKSCKNLVKEIGSYVWDEKSIKLGIDKPLKVRDHCCDVLRYVCFTHFKPIYDGSAEMDIIEYRRWKQEQGWQ